MAQQPHQNVGEVIIDIGPEKKEVSKYDWDEMFKKGKFKKEDMNKLVMDFFINKELTLVAEAFHSESGCPLGIRDISILETQKTVRDLLLNGKIDEAIDLLDEKLHRIFVLDRHWMHFRMEQQKMVELCRRGDFEAALTFSREFIKWEYYDYHIDFSKKVRQTLLLMLYGDDKDSPAAELLHPGRCSVLARRVVEQMIKYQGRNTGHLIDRTMKMVKLAEGDLDKLLTFPKFNRVSGYPEVPPHSHTRFHNDDYF